MTMAQSNSMWGAKRRFTVSDMLASESGSVLSSFLALASRCIVRGLSSVLLFSYFSRHIFFLYSLVFSPPLHHPAQVCLSLLPRAVRPCPSQLPAASLSAASCPSTSIHFQLLSRTWFISPRSHRSAQHLSSCPSIQRAARSAYAWFLRSAR